MRRAAKVDLLHPQVRDLFRANGLEWEDTASVGKGFPDALAYWRPRGHLILIEVKSGAAADKRKGATADAQRAFAHRFPVYRVTSLEHAQGLIDSIKGGS